MKLTSITYLIVGFIQSKQFTFNSTANLVKNLQEYIRFDTVSEAHNYSGVSKWLSAYIKEIGLDLRVVKCNDEKPILIGTWEGANSNLESILLNSHYDVVPANRDLWETDPFGADLGKHKGERVIYGRGSQDDKSITIMYLESLRKLKIGGFNPNRSIHLSIVPGEEINDPEGMDCLIKSPIFKSLNIGAALDEGFPSTDAKFNLFYGERASWKVNVTSNGDTGHSSKFIGNLAINKLSKFLKYAELFRKEEELKSKFLEIGKTATMNLVRIGGGTANNVVPDILWAMFGVRVSPNFGAKKMRRLLNFWANRANVTIELTNDIDPTVSPNGSQAHFYNAILKTTKELGHPINSQIFPGATDSRKLRALGIPSYGITPCVSVEAKAHDHNEYIPIRCLTDGLLFYTNLLPKLANLIEL